jgi:hypothetical protein
VRELEGQQDETDKKRKSVALFLVAVLEKKLETNQATFPF